jgi:Flp pilus assembly pilin Flp
MESTMPRTSEATGPTQPSTLRSRIAMLSRRAAADEQGGTAITYALIAAGIGAAVAATVYGLGATTAMY